MLGCIRGGHGSPRPGGGGDIVSSASPSAASSERRRMALLFTPLAVRLRATLRLLVQCGEDQDVFGQNVHRFDLYRANRSISPPPRAMRRQGVAIGCYRQ